MEADVTLLLQTAFDGAKFAPVRSPSIRQRTVALLVDPRPLTRSTLAQWLTRAQRNFRVMICDPSQKLWAFAETGADIDLIIVNVASGEPEHEAALETAQARFPGVPVVIVADTENPHFIARVLKAGVRGFVSTRLGERAALDAMRTVLGGSTYFPVEVVARLADARAHEPERDEHGAPEPALAPATGRRTFALDADRLTPRERQVLYCLRDGLCNKLVARELSISEHTVKVHLRRIMQKMGCRNRTQVALLAQELPAA